jgi:hypothetical protein
VLAGSRQIFIVNSDELIDCLHIEHPKLRELIQKNLSSQVCSQVHLPILIVVVDCEVDSPCAGHLIDFCFFG